uniref:thymidylate synthase n=1 Tax=uncultured Sphingomonas sp. TaxID=158754 RepID=UPI0035CBA2B3
MKTTDGQPVTIIADNLSVGWARAMLELCKPGITRIAPMTLIIRGFGENGGAMEVPQIRQGVDAFLVSQEKRDVENVAWTIFPQRYLELAGGEREAFFDLFNDTFPRIQTFNARNNCRGSYFQRLVNLSGDGKGVNQLRWILEQYENHPKARRVSKFQATTFDPARDYSNAGQLEFPCLQQVSFTFDGEGLHLNAFYATQQLARKGYGNYLGLARLGAFMANEMGLTFEQLNVFVGVAQMDVGKTNPDLIALLDIVKRHADGARTMPHTA